MANIGNHEIFFGAVFTTEGGGSDVYPSWWNMNIDPIKDLKDWFTEDLSEHYVDVCMYYINGDAKLGYWRVYANQKNAARIYLPPNGTQLFASYSQNAGGTRVAMRGINYKSNGEMFGYPSESSWSGTNILISNNFNQQYLAFIRKNEPFYVYNGTNEAQIL